MQQKKILLYILIALLVLGGAFFCFKLISKNSSSSLGLEDKKEEEQKVASFLRSFIKDAGTILNEKELKYEDVAEKPYGELYQELFENEQKSYKKVEAISEQKNPQNIDDIASLGCQRHFMVEYLPKALEIKEITKQQNGSYDVIFDLEAWDVSYLQDFTGGAAADEPLPTVQEKDLKISTWVRKRNLTDLKANLTLPGTKGEDDPGNIRFTKKSLDLINYSLSIYPWNHGYLCGQDDYTETAMSSLYKVPEQVFSHEEMAKAEKLAKGFFTPNRDPFYDFKLHLEDYPELVLNTPLSQD